MMTFRYIVVTAMTACIVVMGSGCSLFDSDDEGEGEDEEPVGPSSLVVAIGGNFADQNGYLMLYDAESGITVNLPDLGAFAHSVTVSDDKAYVSLNTFSTGRVDVVDLSSGEILQQLSVAAPRSTALYGDEALLATNLSIFGSGGPEPGIVSAIDLVTESIQDAATVGLYPEGIAVTGGRAYVANSGNLGDGTTLSVIDLASSVEARIELGCDGPNEVFVDASGEIIVVCEGKVVYNDDFTEVLQETDGQVVFVNPGTVSVIDRIEFDLRPGSANGSQSAYYDDLSDELYVISDASDVVLRIDTDQNRLAATFQVPDQDDLTGLAAVAYDDPSERLYLARLAKGAGGFADFTSSGAVIVLDRGGTVIDRFIAGPAPSHIEIR
jgi:DNA-binding beta-propeller fold protein YncE